MTELLRAPLQEDLAVSVGTAIAAYSRSSTMRYWDGSAFQEAEANAPAFEPFGLRKHGLARTNLALGSCAFADATYWSTPTSFTITPVTSAIAGETAYAHQADGNSGCNRAQVLGTFGNGRTDTLSLLIENDDATITDIGVFDLEAGAFVHFARLTWQDLGTESIIGAGGEIVRDLGTGPNGGQLVRFSLTLTGAASDLGGDGHTVVVFIYPSGNDPNSNTAIVHHVQYEAGASFPAPPIVTEASTVTVAADSLDFQDDALISDTEGYAYAEVVLDAAANEHSGMGVITLAESSSSGVLYINSGNLASTTDGTETLSASGAITRRTLSRLAARWVSDDMQVVRDGTGSSLEDYDGAWARSEGVLAIGHGLMGLVANVSIGDEAPTESELEGWTTTGLPEPSEPEPEPPSGAAYIRGLSLRLGL